MALPKQLFYVKLVPGGKRPGYYQKGGGKYTSKQMALDHIDNLAARGIEADLYETQELEWSKVSL